MEAIIARCLDSDPDKRPSARELVEFMVHLPQQLSLDGTGSNDLSSGELTHPSRMHSPVQADRQRNLGTAARQVSGAAVAPCASREGS